MSLQRPMTRSAWSDDWSLDETVTYLNHGSFGPSPRFVEQARQQWSRRLEAQPMNFYLRQLEPALDRAYEHLGEFIGAAPDRLLFVDNATFAMNIVARSFPLSAGDEVLLTDHEYGAVQRIWRAQCAEAGAAVVTQPLPWPLEDPQAVVDKFFEGANERTRLIVISHVTSPTAVILPVAAICREARRRGIATCIDGPHAIAMVPLEMDELDCDFYCASCHKWLSASFGSGFLYVAPRQQSQLKPPMISWGRSLGGRPAHWRDEFSWTGTRDPAPWLSVSSAIDFLDGVGLGTFRDYGRQLTDYAAGCLSRNGRLKPIVAPGSNWYASMLAFEVDAPEWPLPQKNQTDLIQTSLWGDYRIEVPLTRHAGRRLLRVSCHLYNTLEQIDYLSDALNLILERGPKSGMQ